MSEENGSPSKTDSLMASLMGDAGGAGGGGEEAPKENGTASASEAAAAAPPTKLAASESSGGGGGLFDDIPVDDDVAIAPAPTQAPPPVPPPPVASVGQEILPEQQQSQQQGATAAGAAVSVSANDEEPPFASAMEEEQHQPPPPPSTTGPSSLLAASGLLGTSATAGGGGGGGGGPAGSTDSSGLFGGAEGGDESGGGLFDDLEREEAEAEELRRRQEQEEVERRRKEAEAAAAAAEEERRRQEAAAAAAAAAAEEERRRQLQQQQEAAAERLRIQQEQQLQQQQQQQQMQFQQQQMQEQMQTVHLTNPATQQQPGYNMNSANLTGGAPMYASYPGPPPPQQQAYGATMPQPAAQAQPGYPPQQQQQPQYYSQSPQQQQQPAQPVQAGFYRDHSMPPQTITTGPMSPGFGGGGAGSAGGGPVPANSNVYAPYGQQQQPAMLQQQQQFQQQDQHQQGGAATGNRFYHPPQQPNVKAGMYNAQPGLGRVPTRPVTEPPPVPSPYSKVAVGDPLFVHGSRGMLGVVGVQPPHWIYHVVTEFKPLQRGQPSPPAWSVWRRFSHVVALEERLRQEYPAAILPPRPDKHAARAIEEASTTQSADFAVQRAAELELYLNQLVMHPVLVNSQVLRLFLSLQDDLGTAWPEVSSNALTRLASVGVGAAVHLSESTAGTKFPWQDGGIGMDEYSEDNAELLAMQSSEAVRMGAVLQAVPKMEGAVTLLREHAEQSGAVGMELSRLVKEVDDRELSEPMEIMANGMLRAGRRSKRLSLELSAAMHTFTQQYKLCRYEKMAFADRKMAIVKRSKERGKADQRATHLILQQRQQMYPHAAGPYGNNMDRMERDAAVSDEIAVDAVQECAEVGERLKSEVNRIAWQRRTEWHAAVKVVASAMKEATSEKLSIWESVREQYLQAFP